MTRSRPIRSREDVARYLDHERIECLECGRRYAFLPTHLTRAHDMTAAEYREAHSLPAGTPLAGKRYREEGRRRIHERHQAGDSSFASPEVAAKASRAASETGRGERPEWLREKQRQIAARIGPKPKHQVGATSPTGRDLVRAREYQQARRAQLAGDPAPMQRYRERFAMTTINNTTWTPDDVRAWVDRHGGNVSACARRLRVPRTLLQAWMSEAPSARELPAYVQAAMETIDELEELRAQG